MKQEIYRLKDISDIKSGKRLPVGHDFAEFPTPYIYIRARDIKKGGISTDNLAYISEQTRERIKRYIICKGDIAITIVANIGDVGYCNDNCHGGNLTENAVRLTNFATDLVDSKYLVKLLSQPHMKQYMESLAAGAAQAKLGIYKIEKIKVSLPEINYQQKIASILSTYDTLIENNTKRIRLLEQMAENLYKEWFVRFRFPRHENVGMEKSKYGKVPSGFKLMKMQDVFDYYVGGGWGEEVCSDDFIEEANVIRGADFPKVWQYDISSCPRRFHKKSNYKARQLEDGDIVMEISGGTSEQPVGRTVLVTQDLIDRYKDSRVICASFCKLIRLKKDIVSPYYFYYWMKFLYDTRIIDRFQLQSTGIINFKFEPFLRKGDVILPTKDVMTAFEKQVKTIHSEMNKLAQSNSLLATQRDLLLPRLMSGKLEVKP